MKYLSEIIKKEYWNGGKWVESVSSEYGFYSISINPKDDGDKHPRLIVVIDDPKDDDESTWMKMIPDQEIDENNLDGFVEKLYDEVGVSIGEICDEYTNFKIRKYNNENWQVIYKDYVVGEYSSHISAIKNVEYRIDNDWASKFGDELIKMYEEKESNNIGIHI